MQTEVNKGKLLIFITLTFLLLAISCNETYYESLPEHDNSISIKPTGIKAPEFPVYISSDRIACVNLGEDVVDHRLLNIYTFNTEGEDIQELYLDRIIRTKFIYRLSCTANGEYLLLNVLSPSETSTDTYLISVADGTTTYINPPQGQNYLFIPEISDDGEWIVYEHYIDESIWRMRVGETDAEMIVEHEKLYWPTLSPDNETVAFSGEGPDDTYDIYTVPFVGGEVNRITDSEYEELDPSWAPDCEHLAYRVYYFNKRADNSDIYIVNTVSDEEPLQITNSAYDPPDYELFYTMLGDRFPDWSPDGNWIVFSRFISGISKIDIREGWFIYL